LRTYNLLAGKLILPFEGEVCLPLCCPALLRACGNHSGEAERSSGIGLKLFGVIPELRSPSSRNTVRNHPGIAFILPRIPQASMNCMKSHEPSLDLPQDF